MTREVDATAVCRELEGLCLSLEAHNRGLLTDGTRQAIRHARCLYSMLGNPLERDRIVPKSGHSLTATYLSELVADLPWQFEFETGQRPEGDVPSDGVKVLRRWLELIRASEAGKLDKVSETHDSLVTAKQLANHARCVDKVIKNALLDRCKPTETASGRNGGHKWRYREAVDVLKSINTGKLKDVEWPESAAELKPRKDSSKIPAKTSKR